MSLQKLTSLPPSELAKIPAGPPPPGVVPDFENGYSIAPAIIAASSAFGGVATLFMILRVYVKAKVVRNWRTEDTLLVLAWILTTIYYSSLLLSTIRGGTGRNQWDYHMDRRFYDGWIFSFWVSNCINQPQLGLAKVAIFFQYWHLFKTKQSMKILIIGGIVAMSVAYLGLTIAFIVLGSPWPGETWLDAVTSWHVTFTTKIAGPAAIVTCIFDWYTLLLPIPSILKLQLTTSKKVGVLFIFLTGGLACVASIISAYYRYNIDLTNVSLTVGRVALWGIIEMWIGIIVACAPTVHMFWNRQTKLVWLSDVFKSSVSQLVGRSSPRSSQNSREKARAAEDRRRMVKLSPSLGSTRASTVRASQDTPHPLDRHLQDLELNEDIPPVPASDQILVEHSYTVSGESQSGEESGADDVEAQRKTVF